MDDQTMGTPESEEMLSFVTRSRPTLLHGWGRTPATSASVLSIHGADNEAVLAQYLAETPDATLTPRGLARSYGDAALGAGGLVTSHLDWRAKFDFDAVKGVLDVSSGFSLEEVMTRLLPSGYFVPVTPGTRQITIGGAFAADVHGKNHHVDGSFGEHVSSVRMVGRDGVHEYGSESPEFCATLGGMGLTGFISSLRLNVMPVESSFVTVETEAPTNIEDTLSRLEENDPKHRYSVAWIDCTRSGGSLGRSVITWGDHTPRSDLPGRSSADPLAFHPATRARFPFATPSWTLNPLTVRAFNQMWWTKGRRAAGNSIEPIGTFFHPLDVIADWNLAYGTKGFLQYQIVVPFKEEATMIAIVELLSSSGFPSFLAVLKRFGEASDGLLSFPRPGWTLALDIPAHRSGLSDLLDRCDALVVGVGGRTYLAKDSRTSPAHIPAMYPKFEEFKKVASSMDPTGIFTSDLSRRLKLRGSTPL